MNFERYHPMVIALFFVGGIGYTLYNLHIVILGISFFGAFLFAIQLIGKKMIRKLLLGYVPFMIMAIAFNVMFNHSGETLLFYLNANPVTLESIVYGSILSLLFVTEILWISCLNKIMTVDKLLCLTGKIHPKLGLFVSMTLRFIPRYKAQLHRIYDGQKCIGRDVTKGNIFRRLLIFISCISILITWSLENAVDVISSMKSRGYGTCKRTSFSPIIMTKRDIRVLLLELCLILVTLGSGRKISARYSPYIYLTKHLSWIFLIAFSLYVILPTILYIKERVKCLR